MMKALIVDDEPLARRNLSKLLKDRFPEIEIAGNTGSVKDTLSWLDTHPAPDVIFLDVELSDGTCFDIFSAREITSPVIMTTAYDRYAVKAFEVNSVDYLLKPMEVEDVRRAIDRVKARGGVPQPLDAPKVRNDFETREKFLVRLNDRIVPVKVQDIAYFYSEAKNSYIVTVENRKYVLDDSLDAIAERLSPVSFFRISRSCIIAESAIDSIQKLLGGRLRVSLRHGLEAGTDLTVSRARVDDFLQWLET